uniref:Uncharacterized protein n=1 Tax=Knipowitschia caucasica TaxID=637954 RepID=A0AAV2K5W3_KNICA
MWSSWGVARLRQRAQLIGFCVHQLLDGGVDRDGGVGGRAGGRSFFWRLVAGFLWGNLHFKGGGVTAPSAGPVVAVFI